MALTPQASKKLERILELMIERDKIMDEINAILSPDEDTDDAPPAPSKTKGKKPRLCKACGKPGHRSDNCPTTKKPEHGNKKWQDLKDDRPKAALTRSQFRDIKESIKRGMGPKDLAAVMNVPLKDINNAMLAADYEGYCSQ